MRRMKKEVVRLNDELNRVEIELMAVKKERDSMLNTLTKISHGDMLKREIVNLAIAEIKSPHAIG